jgi:ABC-type multidrug transport system ATPase subunit
LPKKTPADEIRRLVWHTMRVLGLEDRASTRVGKLSGGQRKRVSVGAELLCRPRLMFLDEPTSGLDPSAESRLMESLRHLAVTGCTILCTTHIMGNAFLFDRLAVMSGGRLVFFGEPAHALEYFGVERLTQLYEGMSSRPTPTGQHTEKVLRHLRVSAFLRSVRSARPRFRFCSGGSGQSFAQTGRISFLRWASQFSSDCWSPG